MTSPHENASGSFRSGAEAGGHKRISYFGFAFDNFKTGVDPCPPRSSPGTK